MHSLNATTTGLLLPKFERKNLNWKNLKFPSRKILSKMNQCISQKNLKIQWQKVRQMSRHKLPEETKVWQKM